MKQQITLKNMVSMGYAYEEAIKTLRTNIQFCGSNIRTIMFTSSIPNEGKSSITFALACSLVQTGKRVLFIDADIRRSVLVSRYQLEQDVFGLSQLLSGQKTLEEVLYATNVDCLDVIFSGPYSPNPAELLEDRAFNNLVEWAKVEYDYIIIDTPPISNVIDAAIVARVCDGVALVVESGAISHRIVQRVMKQIEKTGCRILGVVLNKVSSENGGYYGSYGKYGGKYYGKEYGSLDEGHKHKQSEKIS